MTNDALSGLVERDQDHECPGYGRSKTCVKVAAAAAT